MTISTQKTGSHPRFLVALALRALQSTLLSTGLLTVLPTVLSILLSILLSTLLSTSIASAGSMPEWRAPMLVPKTNHEALRARIYDLFPRAEGRWGAIHVVDRTCSLSTAIVAHLLERRASTDLDELVVVIDRDGLTRREDIELVHAGFRVRVISSDRADLVPLAAPSMVIARPDGSLAYVGGHRVGGHRVGEHRLGGHRVVSRRSPMPDVEPEDAIANDGYIDVQIASELVATGVTALSAPAVGCLAQP
jgi:hypothetical protein